MPRKARGRSTTGERKPRPVKTSAKPYAPCLECGKQGRKVTGDVIFSRPGAAKEIYYLCECGAYCGAHRHNERPFGRPAGYATRRMRGELHRLFDPIWQDGAMGRDPAYEWLADELGIKRLVCHIGLMDQAMLTRAIAAVERKLKELAGEA